ncbi:DUF2252 domain-containing protein [Paenibacillus nanensis]|uniref:DUF2252 domain-containing protein n=1 Tax=Paenibacillus nanensis TaxID=393251 RepID=A0A3A1VIM5_9BACL|nr:DUF2252 family protein [Paenibacillus nanensis]RIX60311.1 DUF2252 domain-containing protein [Paenibacillus nanensis]
MRLEEDITERVKHTQRKLRGLTLSRVLEEFDGEIMGLSDEKRMLKYQKMRGSAYLFFRGSAYLFYFDLGNEWLPYHTDPERPTWIQGDLHFENFGAFRSGKGRIVFDVNDFDEGCMGSYLYDVLRMSVSLFLAMSENAVPIEEQSSTVNTYLSSYVAQIKRYAERKEDPRALVFDEQSTKGPVRKLLRKTEQLASSHFIEKITLLEEGRRSFRWSEEIQKPTDEERELIENGWREYVGQLSTKLGHPISYYQMKDVAVKHGSGTASIGLDRYYVLMEGGAEHQGLDDIIIEIKEVRAPVPVYFMPYNDAFWEQFAHQGKRVITTQQAMHHEADPYLGYLTLNGRHFYARERSPYKKKLKPQKLRELKDWVRTAECMGQITAKLHARADADVDGGLLDYHSEDEIVRAIGKDTDAFCEYVANRALSYSQQVAEDYLQFKEWSEAWEVKRRRAASRRRGKESE